MADTINNNKYKGFFITLWILPVFLLLSACGNKIIVFTGQTMGTAYQIKILGSSDIKKSDIDKQLARINAVFSTWQSDSEITAINNAVLNEWLNVSTELLFVLESAQQVYQQSKGYFDITMGHLSTLWGFQGERQTPFNIPDTHAVFGQQSLHLSDGRIKKSADIKLDVSAIAKGYAVDKLVHFLTQKGYKNFLVEIGGEVSARGYKTDNQPWTVAIEIPNQNDIKAIPLTNQAVATSGSYRNYHTLNGKQYSHILNPKEAFPADNKLISVSVIHSSAMLADAYATALMAMPLEAAHQFAKAQKLKVFFIADKKGELTFTWLP